MAIEGITLDQLKAAKNKLSKKGFVPVPAHPKEKRPLGKWKEYTLSDWSKTMKLLPGGRGNIGILTGEKSTVIVLDIDNKVVSRDANADGSIYSKSTGVQDWETLIFEHGEPKTLKATSPSGGAHYYFQWDDDFAKLVKTTSTCVMSIDDQLCAIDLRGEGGFIMTPPSSLSNGVYAFENEEESIAQLPNWIKQNIISTRAIDKKVQHEEKVQNNYKNVFENDPIASDDFELFKSSKYYQNHKVLNVDSYNRIILKETGDFDCSICKRKHTHHNNHPFLVRHSGQLFFVCRPSNGRGKFLTVVKKEEETEQQAEPPKVEKDTPHYILMSELWSVARKEYLMKSNDWIYKPLEGKPCAYVKHLPYQEWVNQVLRKHKIYLSAPKRCLDIMKHLEMYDDCDLPVLKKDKNVLAFRNGALLLNKAEFITYKDKRLKGVAARHYIDQDFTGGDYTPLFDQVLMHQLSTCEEKIEVYKVVVALIGRLFFDTGKLDKWAVALLLYGESRTGKTTLLNIIKSMFNISEIATLAANTEKIFGLDNMFEKELLLVPEVPHNMKEVFDPTMIQSMIDGDFMNIAGKHKKALTGSFKTPIMMAGNIFPPYDDKRGAIANRIPILVFENLVVEKDTSIEDAVIQNELPNLINKALKMYHTMREDNKGRSFWDFAPVYFKDNQEIARKATNWLHRFLTAPAEENSSTTASFVVKKKVLPGDKRIKIHIEDVKKSFMRYMKFNHPGIKYSWDDNDHSTFKSLGYQVERQHICKSCNNPAKGGKDKCCKEYDAANRTKRTFIFDLLIERIEKDGATPTFGLKRDFLEDEASFSGYTGVVKKLAKFV
ncbi:bifunctional DNA primase/polymerase [Phlyctochytrium arcticum]|nr:bifunctional DNA primase/polymerase [Phlyctochytrium arcticum]